jgi:hypothetical protein
MANKLSGVMILQDGSTSINDLVRDVILLNRSFETTEETIFRPEPL